MIKMKLFAFIMILVLMLAGCDNAEKGKLTIYSFSGENEQVTISNGVVVLNGTEEIFDGGDLRVAEDFFTNIKSYTTTFYIMSGKDKNVILSNNVEDMTGGTLNFLCDLGKTAGDNTVISGKIDDDNDLNNNLYFELVTIDTEGKRSVYQLQMSLSEITKNDVD